MEASSLRGLVHEIGLYDTFAHGRLAVIWAEPLTNFKIFFSPFYTHSLSQAVEFMATKTFFFEMYGDFPETYEENSVILLEKLVFESPSSYFEGYQTRPWVEPSFGRSQEV